MKKLIMLSAALFTIILLSVSSIIAADDYEGTYIQDGRSFSFMKKKMVIKKTGDTTYTFTMSTKKGRMAKTYEGKICTKPKKQKGMIQVLQFTLKTSNVTREVEVYQKKSEPGVLVIQGSIYRKQ